MASHCPDPASRGAPEPPVYFLAAKGDHDAQAEMARLMISSGVDGDVPIDTAVSLALFWGQMAATSRKASHLLGYAGLLLSELSRTSDEAVASGDCEDQFATALAIIDSVADAGHNRAEFISFAMASRVPAAVIAKASALKSQFAVEPLTDDEKRPDDAGMQMIAAALGADALGVC